MTERPDVTPSDVSGSDVSGSDVSGSDVSGLGYEQARDELAEVVRALEVGGLGLDESVALWERGEALARRCEEQLAGARDRVKVVLEHADDPPAE